MEVGRAAVNKEIWTDDLKKDLGLNRVIEKRAIEVGNIFTLGARFSEPFDLKYKDEKGEERMVFMGSYGIGLGRLMGTIVELLSDCAFCRRHGRDAIRRLVRAILSPRGHQYPQKAAAAQEMVLSSSTDHRQGGISPCECLDNKIVSVPEPVLGAGSPGIRLRWKAELVIPAMGARKRAGAMV